jgi:RimJ/RimL family protein N-acetyltransferase
VAAAFPETVLRGPEFVLRPFSPTDVADNQAAASDELVQQWIPLPAPYTLDDSIDWCTRTSHALRESGDGIHFAITDPRTDRMLGTIGLNKTDWPRLVSEVGYSVAPWARGQGIAARATRVLARWLLIDQDFQRLELKAATGNLASQNTALNAGFHREGIMRNAGLTHSGRVDLVLYSLTPTDIATS